MEEIAVPVRKMTPKEKEIAWEAIITVQIPTRKNKLKVGGYILTWGNQPKGLLPVTCQVEDPGTKNLIIYLSAIQHVLQMCPLELPLLITMKQNKVFDMLLSGFDRKEEVNGYQHEILYPYIKAIRKMILTRPALTEIRRKGKQPTYTIVQNMIYRYRQEDLNPYYIRPSDTPLTAANLRMFNETTPGLPRAEYMLSNRLSTLQQAPQPNIVTSSSRFNTPAILPQLAGPSSNLQASSTLPSSPQPTSFSFQQPSQSITSFPIGFNIPVSSSLTPQYQASDLTSPMSLQTQQIPSQPTLNTVASVTNTSAIPSQQAESFSHLQTIPPLLPMRQPIGTLSGLPVYQPEKWIVPNMTISSDLQDALARLPQLQNQMQNIKLADNASMSPMSPRKAYCTRSRRRKLLKEREEQQDDQEDSDLDLVSLDEGHGYLNDSPIVLETSSSSQQKYKDVATPLSLNQENDQRKPIVIDTLPTPQQNHKDAMITSPLNQQNDQRTPVVIDTLPTPQQNHKDAMVTLPLNQQNDQNDQDPQKTENLSTKFKHILALATEEIEQWIDSLPDGSPMKKRKIGGSNQKNKGSNPPWFRNTNKIEEGRSDDDVFTDRKGKSWWPRNLTTDEGKMKMDDATLVNTTVSQGESSTQATSSHHQAQEINEQEDVEKPGWIKSILDSFSRK